ncbi:MAG: RsmB/NOP family class I SAM-dependent RNA methyltransferase [Clostridia bacterium]|nr:RsmB/NOP family class I SAM-dependent RNA methyltransferase [Clostridia bacterium]
MDNLPNFFIEELYRDYGENLAKTTIEGLVKKKTSFRVNNLLSNNAEIESALEKASILFKKVAWYDKAYVIENNKISDLDIYKEGKIYVQNLSSMIPPIVLDPKPGEDILDMCAAPGGKTTEIACLSNNQAHITACEMNPIRIERLKHNIKMQGASAYVMSKDSRNLDNFLKYDKILLDSPCSGSGTLDRFDESNKKFFTEYLIQKSIKSQKTLLNKAINLTKKGGIIVYSTCSILKRENEEVIESVIRDKKVELVPIDLKQMTDIPVFHQTVIPTDIYEGFFVAKLRKIV